MYNRYDERVREGIGWIGDLNTGNGTPGSKNEETDTDEIDQHPGNGTTKEKTNNKNGDKNTKTDDAGVTVDNVEITVEEETTEEITTNEVTIEDEVTDDITTDLVKENPYRYAGYYFDRKTQFYYLQARYYDARVGRFISLDSWDGNISNPLSLNKYIYSLNNPINFIDSTGLKPLEFADSVSKSGSEIVYEIETTYRDSATKQAQAYLQYMGFDIGKEGIDGVSVKGFQTFKAIQTFQMIVGLKPTGKITGFDDPTLKKMKEAVGSDWNTSKDIKDMSILNPNYDMVTDENLLSSQRIREISDKYGLTGERVEALYKINDYAKTRIIRSKLDENPDTPLIFSFEGLGDYTKKQRENSIHYQGRYGAMTVVIRGNNTSIFFNTSTLPDGIQYATAAEGIYNFNSGSHFSKEGYPALHLENNGGVISYYGGVNNKAGGTIGIAYGIHLHKGSNNDNPSDPTSKGCLLVYPYDDQNGYVDFGQAVGFLNQDITPERENLLNWYNENKANPTYKEFHTEDIRIDGEELEAIYIEGLIIIDRSYMDLNRYK